MGWKIIEIEDGDALNLFLDNLIIHAFESKIIIPLSDIDTILIHNYKLKITTRLLCELANHNISVIICNNNHYPCCQCLNLNGNYNTLKIFQKQMDWTNQYKDFLWKNIVRQKITNQALFLKKMRHVRFGRGKFRNQKNDNSLIWF